MADSESKTKQKHAKKKRKLKGPEGDRGPSKKQRFDFPEKQEEEDANEVLRKPEEGRHWGNLQLILSLQRKDVLLQELVSLAFFFLFDSVKLCIVPY